MGEEARGQPAVAICRERLGEHVGRHQLGRHVHKAYFLPLNGLASEVELGVDVLGRLVVAMSSDEGDR